MGSVQTDKPLKSMSALLNKRNYSKKMQQWKIDPPTLFVSREDIASAEFHIKSDSDSKCIESTSKKVGATFEMKACDPNVARQKWRVDMYGVLRLSNTTRCIQNIVTNGINNLSLQKKCDKSTAMFMFDITDSSLVWKKKGKLAFTNDGSSGELSLSAKNPSNITQQWTLDLVIESRRASHH